MGDLADIACRGDSENAHYHNEKATSDPTNISIEASVSESSVRVEALSGGHVLICFVVQSDE